MMEKELENVELENLELEDTVEVLEGESVEVEVEYEPFTMDMLSRAHKKYENLKEAFIAVNVDGEEKVVTVEVYRIFSPIAIKQCIAEYVKNMEVAKNVDKYGMEDVAEPYLLYLMVKHFTTLGESMPKNFKEQLTSLQYMINENVLFQIVAHFDETEVERVKKGIEEIIVTFEDNYGLVDEMKAMAKEQLEYKAIISE